MTKRNFINSSLLVMLLVADSCMQPTENEGLPFYNSPDFTPRWITSTDKEYASVHTIAPFSFTNQLGETITNKNVSGKVYVANFFFTRCTGICPKMNGNLKKVATAFADNAAVLILSHSVTPAADSVARLLQYGKSQNIDPEKWWLLTGDREKIYTLARTSYFADEEAGYNTGSKEFLHTENALLIDQKGRIRGVYNATLELEMNKLIEHIHRLLSEEAHFIQE